VHHQAGNYIVRFSAAEQPTAAVQCYAIASHYKEKAKKGQTRQFVGFYDLHLVQTAQGWRLDAFKYNLKYTSGNMELE
jgi:hypothetical protein